MFADIWKNKSTQLRYKENKENKYEILFSLYLKSHILRIERECQNSNSVLLWVVPLTICVEMKIIHAV